MKNETKRTVVRWVVIAVLIANVIAILFALVSCSKAPANISVTENRQPSLFPDYKEVRIPANIAPLNFRIDEDGTDKCYVKLTGSKAGELEVSGKNKVHFNQKRWKEITEANKNGHLSVEVFTCKNNQWTAWEPFHIYVAEEDIDPYMAYRLIEPGYEKWHIVGIYQRDLESFKEQTIIRNDMVGYNCINCHSFCGGSPDQMMFHMRAANGGTYIVENEKVQKLNTKTQGTISNMTYPYWHPSGRYIATSVNETRQFFHAVKEKKMEVFDLESDVVIYDVEKQEILSRASIITKDAFETFPSFSPDGKWLYFCSAPATQMPDNYNEVRYNLCRVAFDPAKGEISYPVDTLVKADKLSTSFPRISPDGRFLMYTETAYGQFPIWHKDAEIQMINLANGSRIDMSRINSPDTESYHSWSSNSRWVVVSSRRDNGLYTLPYLCYIAEDGTPSKPFVLPQEDPDAYDYLLYSYNIPELITGEVSVSPYAIQQTALNEKAKQVSFR